jgi:hypothetical protein
MAAAEFVEQPPPLFYYLRGGARRGGDVQMWNRSAEGAGRNSHVTAMAIDLHAGFGSHCIGQIDKCG